MTQIIGAEKDELVGALRVVKQFLDQGHTLVWLIAEDDRPQPGFMEEELERGIPRTSYNPGRPRRLLVRPCV